MSGVTVRTARLTYGPQNSARLNPLISQFQTRVGRVDRTGRT